MPRARPPRRNGGGDIDERSTCRFGAARARVAGDRDKSSEAGSVSGRIFKLLRSCVVGNARRRNGGEFALTPRQPRAGFSRRRAATRLAVEDGSYGKAISNWRHRFHPRCPPAALPAHDDGTGRAAPAVLARFCKAAGKQHDPGRQSFTTQPCFVLVRRSDSGFGDSGAG